MLSRATCGCATGSAPGVAPAITPRPTRRASGSAAKPRRKPKANGSRCCEVPVRASRSVPHGGSRRSADEQRRRSSGREPVRSLPNKLRRCHRRAGSFGTRSPSSCALKASRTAFSKRTRVGHFSPRLKRSFRKRSASTEPLRRATRPPMNLSIFSKVIYALGAERGLTPETLEELRVRKAQRRGTFSKRLMTELEDRKC